MFGYSVQGEIEINPGTQCLLRSVIKSGLIERAVGDQATTEAGCLYVLGCCHITVSPQLASHTNTLCTVSSAVRRCCLGHYRSSQTTAVLLNIQCDFLKK